jgi:hypothetical protein
MKNGMNWKGFGNKIQGHDGDIIPAIFCMD